MISQPTNQPDDALADVKQLAGAACESATQIIKEHPIASAVVVAGVGVGVGLLLSRVIKDSPVIASVLTDEEIGGQIMQAVSKAAPDLLAQVMGNR